MRVKELWRYPVKSLQGEPLAAAMLTADGLDGDRRYAIFDLDTGLGLTARRVPELLVASAALTPDRQARITLPDGSIADTDGALSDWLGRRVALRSAEHNAGSRYENVVDFEHEQSSAWETFSAPTCCSTAHHGTRCHSHRRRGDFEIGRMIQRCVMVTRPQPGGIDHDPTVLRTIARERAARLAVGALVTHPGTIRVGNELHPR